MGREHRLVPGLGLRDGELQQQQHPARDGAWGEPAVGVQCWDQPQRGATRPDRRPEVSGAWGRGHGGGQVGAGWEQQLLSHSRP